MSHTDLAGPTIRLAYLAVWAAPPALLARALDVPAPGGPDVVLACTGYDLSQWLHLLCDGIYPLDR